MKTLFITLLIFLAGIILLIILLLIASASSTTFHYQRPPDPPEPPTISATVTKYGWTGNKMANGEFPYPGAVATSDRTIPLGTKIEIDGKEYVVKDRTHKKIQERFGLTVDLYSEESNEKMLEFGRRNVLVRIY